MLQVTVDSVFVFQIVSLVTELGSQEHPYGALSTTWVMNCAPLFPAKRLHSLSVMCVAHVEVTWKLNGWIGDGGGEGGGGDSTRGGDGGDGDGIPHMHVACSDAAHVTVDVRSRL